MARTDDELLHAAEDALYAAKTLGRDRTCSTAPRSRASWGRARGEATRNQAQLATVLNLAEALDMRDTGTARHSQPVGRYSDRWRASWASRRDQIERIHLAGVLHDIGKIGVPDAILRKPGR